MQLEREQLRALGLLTELSKGGAFVETDLPAPTGTRVKVIFTRQGGAKATLAADVRYGRMDPRGLGLQWVDLAPEARAYVEDLVARARKSLRTRPPPTE